jgi:prolycopene isomerase
MGTGTPAVTTSGLSAANAVLKKLNLEPFKYQANMKNCVRVLDKPFTPEGLYRGYPEEMRIIMCKASRCQYCENPSCSRNTNFDIRGVMRRVTVGNFAGAKKLAKQFLSIDQLKKASLVECEKQCVLNENGGPPVEIQTVIDYIITK